MTFSHLKTESRAPWVFVNLGREVGDLAALGPLHVLVSPSHSSAPCLPCPAQSLSLFRDFSLLGSHKLPEVSLLQLCHCLVSVLCGLSQLAPWECIPAHVYTQHKPGYVETPWSLWGGQRTPCVIWWATGHLGFLTAGKVS